MNGIIEHILIYNRSIGVIIQMIFVQYCRCFLLFAAIKTSKVCPLHYSRLLVFDRWKLRNWSWSLWTSIVLFSSRKWLLLFSHIIETDVSKRSKLHHMNFILFFLLFGSIFASCMKRISHCSAIWFYLLADLDRDLGTLNISRYHVCNILVWGNKRTSYGQTCIFRINLSSSHGLLGTLLFTLRWSWVAKFFINISTTRILCTSSTNRPLFRHFQGLLRALR